MYLELKIVTPERIVFEDKEVAAVILPTATGEITILPNHIPLVSLLRAGIARVKKGNNEEILLAVSSGVIEVDGKKIVILADTADRAEELEKEKIEKAKEEAKKIMAEKRADREGFAEAEAGLERELARLKLIRKYHHQHGPRPRHEE